MKDQTKTNQLTADNIVATVQNLLYMQEHPEEAPADLKELHTLAMEKAGVPAEVVQNVLDELEDLYA